MFCGAALLFGMSVFHNIHSTVALADSGSLPALLSETIPRVRACVSQMGLSFHLQWGAATCSQTQTPGGALACRRTRLGSVLMMVGDEMACVETLYQSGETNGLIM